MRSREPLFIQWLSQDSGTLTGYHSPDIVNRPSRGRLSVLRRKLISHKLRLRYRSSGDRLWDAATGAVIEKMQLYQNSNALAISREGAIYVGLGKAVAELRIRLD